ncbi:hypothetical protein [Pseudomonas anguilliseptica]|uniref:hypothetical protein n=1 Tax=Pseudomonas anguilliseptica TaxID=53406 RepID=UPI0022B05A29|nr:hypothetical protein [Pseudomonas anguilliseptica]MCZ4324382.1 hypothetical protein [Pseudomonas anguilliseptica]
MSCRVFFESLSADGGVSERASLIDGAHPRAECEAESVSGHSNGVVADGEYVHRYVFSPLHVHDGKVVTAVFSDAKDKGLSCERGDSLVPTDDLHARARVQVERFNTNRRQTQPERSYVGAISAQVRTVRALKAGEQRVYSVYDTALGENVFHVDVFEIPSALKALSKAEQKLERLRLAEAFTGEPVSV